MAPTMDSAILKLLLLKEEHFFIIGCKTSTMLLRPKKNKSLSHEDRVSGQSISLVWINIRTDNLECISLGTSKISFSKVSIGIGCILGAIYTGSKMGNFRCSMCTNSMDTETAEMWVCASFKGPEDMLYCRRIHAPLNCLKVAGISKTWVYWTALDSTVQHP
ncbi:hypothetical protein BT96DRAFT_942218 [Gymnopus androsaceus JB14]|uniref:Uncharacterized protein n=1 Tax=Gymnopus androsaceus JB14 TaxID=1447944 RepID=A0A6A4HF67_9AGAR|nr:hypothetical protein BT96DRAFT_942218 [Gymnopus androsaceus JB14]